MRRLQRTSIIVSLVALLLTTTFFPDFAKAAEGDSLGLTAEAAILIEAESGKILYQKNPDTSLPPASMTKMMTEYITLEAIKEGKISWDQETGISEYVYNISQNRNLSNVPLRREGKYTVRELYESMAIYSANASTIALAELIAGSETNFVKLMNEKGKELGLKDYKFVNTTGLNNSDLLGMHPQGTDKDEENMMSARSAALLAYHLLKDFPEVLETSSIPVKTFRENTNDAIRMDNWNWMIPGTMYGVYDYEGVDGIKTGSTVLAGYCFTGTAVKNGMRLISVVMKTDSYGARFGNTKKLLDYGFSNFTVKELFPAGYKIEGNSDIPVYNGKQKTVQVETQRPAVMVVQKTEEDLYEPVYKFNESLLKDGALTAPLEKGQVVGTMSLKYKGDQDYGYLTDECKTNSEIPVITSAEVKKASWFVRLIRGIGSFISGIFNKK